MLRRLVGAVRRNHALEHATVTLLLSRIPSTRMVGRASRDGFYLWARVPTEQLEAHVHEGLMRLKGGESRLAVTPLCGTNLAIGGFLAGAAAMVALGSQRRLDRLPSVTAAAMFGLVAAQPLGRLAQQYITTSADLNGMEIVGVRSLGGGLHKVETRWGA